MPIDRVGEVFWSKFEDLMIIFLLRARCIKSRNYKSDDVNQNYLQDKRCCFKQLKDFVIYFNKFVHVRPTHNYGWRQHRFACKKWLVTLE